MSNNLNVQLWRPVYVGNQTLVAVRERSEGIEWYAIYEANSKERVAQAASEPYILTQLTNMIRKITNDTRIDSTNSSSERRSA